MVHDFHRYPHFIDYLKIKEDEEAWQRASNLNTIEAYQKYFNEFHNGKYKEQTHQLILELREIERRRAEEIKKIAEEEKQRRREGSQRSQAPPPPPPQPEVSATRQQGLYTATQQQEPPSYAPISSRKGERTIRPGWFIVTSLLIVASIFFHFGVLRIFIPLLGLGLGLYTSFARKDGQPTYDKQTRKYGNFMLILGVIVYLWYFTIMFGIF
jgi:hypothetical protein